MAQGRRTTNEVIDVNDEDSQEEQEFQMQRFSWQPFPLLRARRPAAMVVSLQVPWDLLGEKSHPVCYRKLVPPKETVEEFLYNFLIDLSPLGCWRSFQQKHAPDAHDPFGIRTGPNYCFMIHENQKKSSKKKGSSQRPQIFHVGLANSTTPYTTWEATDTMVDLLDPLTFQSSSQEEILSLVVQSRGCAEPLFLNYQQLFHITLPPLDTTQENDTVANKKPAASSAKKQKTDPKLLMNQQKPAAKETKAPKTKKPATSDLAASPTAKKPAARR
jgi:hypothetical protein